MAHAWATTNALAGLAESAFTFTNWTASNKSFLNDAAMDGACSTGTASGTTRYLDINFGVATDVYGFALLNHNLASWSTPTVAITGATDAAFTTGLVTKTASDINQTAPNEKECVLLLNAGAQKRYWRLTFGSDATEALRLGELFAITSNNYQVLSRLKVYGWGESEEFISNRAAMRTGNVRASFLAGPIRSKRLPFVDMQGASQREELMAMWRAAKGDATPLLWIEQRELSAVGASNEGQECLYGRLQSALSWRETDYTLYDVDALELRSLGRDVGR
jgi:hypothetical protein